MTQLTQIPQKNKNLNSKTIPNNTTYQPQNQKINVCHHGQTSIFNQLYQKLKAYTPIQNMKVPEPQFTATGKPLPLHNQIPSDRYGYFEAYSRQNFELFLLEGNINLEIELDDAFAHSPSRASHYLKNLAQFSAQATQLILPEFFRYIDRLMNGWGGHPQNENDLVLQIIFISLMNLAPELQTNKTILQENPIKDDDNDDDDDDDDDEEEEIKGNASNDDDDDKDENEEETLHMTTGKKSKRKREKKRKRKRKKQSCTQPKVPKKPPEKTAALPSYRNNQSPHCTSPLPKNQKRPPDKIASQALSLNLTSQQMNFDFYNRDSLCTDKDYSTYKIHSLKPLVAVF